MSDFTHRSIQVNGIQLHYVTAGSGPLLLLLHGFPEFWYSWRHQIAELAQHYTVVAPDQRGYNLSDKPGWGYSIDVLVSDVVELIQALGYERAVLAGHDWGGAVAWAAAIAYPHRFERLIILNAPHPAIFAKHLRSNRRQLLRSWYMGFFTLPLLPELALRANNYAVLDLLFSRSHSPADRAAYKAALDQPGALTAALNWYRAAAQQSTQGLLVGKPLRIELPTLVIWGEADLFLGKELSYGMQRYVPNLVLHYLPGISHWVQQEAPAQVNQYILEFLGKPA